MAVREHGFGPSALATPANAITLGRLALTPLLLLVVLSVGPSWPSLVLWVALAATDGFDGYLARRHGATRSGAFLDPLADKALVLGGLGALVARGDFWWPPVAVIAAREAAISFYRGYWGRRGLAIHARRSAKVKTVCQEVAVGIALLPVGGEPRQRVAALALWLAAALTVGTGLQYLLDGRQAATHT
jgi:CDP-diacylglycerol--glycerol-3-phosphate 3-phosphatidyltransferase